MKVVIQRFTKAVFHTAFFICVTLLLSGCDKNPDEEQIQLIMDEMIAAAEAGRPGDIASHLHENFQANQHMDIQQVKQLLMLHGMQHATISINVVSSQTTMDPVYTDKASTLLSVIVTGSSERGLPEDGSIRVVKLEWRKDGDWELLKADWEM